MNAVDWELEIRELHDFFQAYFLGETDDIARVQDALAPGFTMIGPRGDVRDRTAVIDQIVAGYAHTNSLTIEIQEPTFVHQDGDTVVSRYVEVHRLRDGSNRRIATVVFNIDPTGPNGVRWLLVQETFVDT